MLSFSTPATAVREDAVIITVRKVLRLLVVLSLFCKVFACVLQVRMCFAKMGMVTIQLRIIY
jgi:hypothetical protein